jgi:hypothetical protein
MKHSGQAEQMRKRIPERRKQFITRETNDGNGRMLLLVIANLASRHT